MAHEQAYQFEEAQGKPVACPICGNQLYYTLASQFCSRCGKRYKPPEPTLADIMGETVEGLVMLWGELVTKKTAAKIIGKSTRTVNTKIQRGEISQNSEGMVIVRSLAKLTMPDKAAVKPVPQWRV